MDLTNFRMAKRDEATRVAKKAELDAIFAKAIGNSKGKNNKVDMRGMDELHKHRIDIAELIVELVADDAAQADPTGFFVDRKTIGINDTALIREHQGTLKVVNRAYGTKPLSSRLTATERSFTTSHKEIAIEIPLEEVATGATSPSQLISAMGLAIARHKVALVLDAIDAAVPAVAAGNNKDRLGMSGEAGYQLRYAGLTAGNLEKALDGLKEEGESPVIFGRQSALYPTIRGATFIGSEEGKFQLEERGVVGRFQGAPVVTMADRYSKILGGYSVRNDRVWIAGSTKGATMYDVDVSFLNWALLDERTATFGTGIRLSDGVFVHNPFQYRLLEV